MLTSGDIQFEPSTQKIFAMTSSIVVMTSGDAGFHSEILQGTFRRVNQRIESNPTTWVPIPDVVDFYILERTAAKIRRSESELLGPLSLDRESFLYRQATMEPALVEKLARDLINFDVPSVAAIVAGVDSTGAHLYEIRDGVSTCCDSIGFACIGIGERHAQSHLMFAQYARSHHLGEALLLTYAAKKRAEVAPGVGAATDMIFIGPEPGSFIQVGSEHMKRLATAYSTMDKAEKAAARKARKEMSQYVEQIRAAAAQQAQQQQDGASQASPRKGGGGPDTPPTSEPH
jgi:hypothetical protein